MYLLYLKIINVYGQMKRARYKILLFYTYCVLKDDMYIYRAIHRKPNRKISREKKKGIT